MQPESGDPLDWQNPQNRHGGRIRCVAESAATHREMCFTASTNHAGTAPIAEGPNRLSAGRQWWVAPGDVFRGVNEPRGHSTNRRRHKPALSRTAKVGGTGRCVSRGQRTARALRQSPKAQTGSQPDGRGCESAHARTKSISADCDCCHQLPTGDLSVRIRSAGDHRDQAIRQSGDQSAEITVPR